MYVLDAIVALGEIKREELHDIERPIAYLAFQNAEINRDNKKRRKPFSPDDFYYYADLEKRNLPEPKYGAAAKELIQRGDFPGWALFVYGDLKLRADEACPPELLCFQCEDAIILAPSREGRVITGLLIAGETASGQRREMVSPCGKHIYVELPAIRGKFIADEEAEVLLLS